MPEFSIITVCLNAASTIEGAINSVLSQTCPPFEYIIIDGGSTDGTLDIIERYRSRLTHVISEPDRGIYDAFNKGLALASGDIIGILNSDDAYAPWALSTVADAYMLSPSAGVIYGKQATIDVSKKLWRVCLLADYNKLSEACMIPHSAAFVARSMYERYGFYNSDFKIASDFDFMLRLFNSNETFYPVDSVLVAFRNTGVSSTQYLPLIREYMQICKNSLNPLTALKFIVREELKYHGKRLIRALGLWEAYASYRDEKLLNAEASGKFEQFDERFWDEIKEGENNVTA